MNELRADKERITPEYLQRVSDIEDREAWTRDRFLEHLQRITDIEDREKWTRERFEECFSRLQQLKQSVDEINTNKILNSDDMRVGGWAQQGEDSICFRIFRYLSIDPAKISYLDLGANHAKEMSNTYAFYELGAQGVLIEANPELISELKTVRSRDIILNCAIALEEKEEVDFYILSGDGLSTIDYNKVIEVCKRKPTISIKSVCKIPMISIENVIAKFFANKAPEILSIDLEGVDEEILKRIDFNSFRPTIIILECIPFQPYLVIDAKETHLIEYMKRFHYAEFAFTGVNAILVDALQVAEASQRIKRTLGLINEQPIKI
jgi:FkbM family methyltransferase